MQQFAEASSRQLLDQKLESAKLEWSRPVYEVCSLGDEPLACSLHPQSDYFSKVLNSTHSCTRAGHACPPPRSGRRAVRTFRRRGGLPCSCYARAHVWDLTPSVAWDAPGHLFAVSFNARELAELCFAKLCSASLGFNG